MTSVVQSEDRVRVSVVPFLSNVSQKRTVLSQEDDARIPEEDG